ncbi:MAG: AMP-binding protein, partial [Cyanobacteria bacterium]|nr:AMP-binding protein [Cyanobacteriota bacterium]
MKTLNDTLVRRFWSHVFENTNGIAVFVKNESRKRQDVFVVPAAPFGFATTVTVEKPPHLALTWREVGLLVSELMLKLKNEGLKKGDAAAILSWNCPEWVWTDMAIASLGAFSVPIYPNSTSDQVNYILKDSEAKVLLGDAEDQTVKVHKASGVKTLLFAEGLAHAPDYSGRARPLTAPINKPNVLNFRKEAHEELARIKGEFERTARGEGCFLGIDPQDIFTLIYTSGSTGVPKGVPLLHANIAAACQALIRHGFDFTPADRYLSYLPLAHVYERVNGTSLCLWVGVPSAFCRVDEMVDVVKQIKPTVILGVPAVWRKIKDKAEAELKAKTGVSGHIVKWALKQTTPGWKRAIADFLVFRKIRAALGGHVRMMLSGGAPIARDILAFFELVSVPNKEFMLRQGYGLTETAGGIAVNTAINNKEGSVGRLVDCIEVFIVPVSDETDAVETARGLLPQSCEAVNEEKAANGHKVGLIFLRGDCITPGYWDLPEENAKSFVNDWFNTGDLGY